ncbi:MAG TPA: ABC transporter permease subunit [Candidatus Acidoferrum sp.]|nr:ABC transporter permease subunit [Candidatus Acidoferrum sp.]
MMRLITNPMINKELRQRLRERRAWLLPTLYLLILSGTVSFAYYMTTDAEMRSQREVQGADIGLAIFFTVVFTQIIALLLMAPVFSAGSITIEKEQRTLTGLLTSLLSVTQIWWGKFVAALLYLLLLLLSALPILALSFAFGGVEPLQLVRATASTVLVLAAICSVGLWCSATFRRSIHSTAACYGIVLVLSVVTAVIFGILMSHWSSRHFMLMRRGDGPPAYVQAPLFLNPLYPLLSMMDDADFREFIYPTSSWLLFAAMGCLAAAFAMRRLKRGSDQL